MNSLDPNNIVDKEALIKGINYSHDLPISNKLSKTPDWVDAESCYCREGECCSFLVSLPARSEQPRWRGGGGGLSVQ